jgi:2-oxoisovalerate dehydrogenase E1 component
MTAVPGLSVVYPSHRHDVGLLLKNAVVRWPNPTLFFEHKLLYAEAADAGSYEILTSKDVGTELFPTLIRRTEGVSDLTIVAYGGMLPVVEKFAEELQQEEIDVEILVPALLAPLPKESLLAHLMDRPSIMVVEEGYGASGFGVSLGCALAEAGYTGRFRRVNPPPVPIPAARSLEALVIPDRRQMMAAVMDLLLPT